MPVDARSLVVSARRPRSAPPSFHSAWRNVLPHRPSPSSQCFPGCSQGPFFNAIYHCLVLNFFYTFAEFNCNDDDDDDDESSSCNSLCQFLYHCHCLLLSLYICVISLKCNGKAGLPRVCVSAARCSSAPPLKVKSGASRRAAVSRQLLARVQSN